MHKQIDLNETVDVLIAGGGIAGAAAAAALSQLGLDILIIEPGLQQGRRLAGELIHPPGIDGLRELGLLGDTARLGSDVKGFAIFPGGVNADQAAMVLPYGRSTDGEIAGLAIEHNVLKTHLLETVRSFPGVTVWHGARVIELERGADDRYAAIVRTEGGIARVQARMILGADGPMSQLRKMAGISHDTQRYSGMTGVEVDDTHLPHHGFGNIFLNPAGVAYAYGIGEGRARIMFEVLRGADAKESIATHLSYFPESFRADIEQVIATSKPLAAANYCIVPEVSVKGNFVLVGDARGCCHPLTASGITAAVKDAMVLRDSLRKSRMDLNVALRRYARICGRLELTRRTLAEELREAFLAKTPEMRLLNECIFAYWRSSETARMHSMALLSTLDSSIFSLAKQYAMVSLQSFRLFPHWLANDAGLAWHRGVASLLWKSVEFQRTAIRQSLREYVGIARAYLPRRVATAD
ncbi:MAG: NAD(P)/FAD-dependent oxidoreductase [Methylotetracoccus sp.]